MRINITRRIGATVAAAVLAGLPLAGCGDQVTYRSCDDAKAAGAAPLHTGDPGYSRKLDRDGDGVACDH